MESPTWPHLERISARFILSEYVYRGSPTSTVSTSTNATSTKFSAIGMKFVLVEFPISKFVLVEFVLVETVLVGDPLYSLFPNLKLNNWFCHKGAARKSHATRLCCKNIHIVRKSVQVMIIAPLVTFFQSLLLSSWHAHFPPVWTVYKTGENVHAMMIVIDFGKTWPGVL